MYMSPYFTISILLNNVLMIMSLCYIHVLILSLSFSCESLARSIYDLICMEIVGALVRSYGLLHWYVMMDTQWETSPK